MLRTTLINNQDKIYIKEINNILKSWLNTDKNFDIKDAIATIILLKNQELIGFYQILNHDNDNTFYTPWLANVFIKEEYRNQGYGRILISSIPKYLKNLNITTLYLHTRHENLYEKFGWQKLEPLDLGDGIKRNIYTLKK